MTRARRARGLALALALAGAGHARAQLTVSHGTGRYAPGAYAGPCREEMPSSDIPLESLTRSLIESTLFTFDDGEVVGRVTPPNCVPVQLDPGKYVMTVMHGESVIRLHCQFLAGEKCREAGFVHVSDNDYERDTPFTIDSTCTPPRKGRIASLVGTAHDAAGRRLTVGSELPVGAVIVTGRGSRLTFTDEAGDQFFVGPNSRFTNDNHLCGAKRRLSARLILGIIWTKVSHVISGGEEFEVRTDNAVCGVRGTRFQVEARDSAGHYISTIRVSEGTVVVRGIASGDSVAVRANQMTRVVGDKAPERPRPLPPGVSAEPPGGWFR